MRFTCVRVPGEEAVDLADVVVGGDWREGVAD